MSEYNVPVLSDFSWQPPVKDKDLTEEPGSGIQKGDRYIVKAVAGSDWAGEETHIAMAKQDDPTEAGHWIFGTSVEGWIVWVDDEDQYYYFDGTSWVPKIDPPAINAALSSMILTGGEISEGSDAGTIKVAALTAMLRTGTGASDPLVKISLAEQDNVTLAEADIWYKVRLTYGSPCTIATSESGGNGANIIGIGHCLKEDDDTVHYSEDGLRLTDGVRKLHKRASSLREIEISSGGLCSDPDTRHLQVTSGIFYRGINRFETSEFDSTTSGDTFAYYYWNPDGSTWAKDDNGGSGYAQIDNANYNKVDSGSGKAALGPNKYTTNWIFLHPDDEHILVLYGRSYTTLTAAENEEIPPSLPDMLDEMAALLCKVIVQEGSDTLIFENVKYFTFTPQVVVDHNELSGLQGGQADEYYHLTSAKHALVSDIGGLTPTNGKFIVGDGATWVAESGTTVRTSLGLGTGDSPTFTGAELTRDGANTELVISTYHDTEATTPLLTMRKADGTSGSPALVDDDAVLGTIHFDGYNETWVSGAKIEARVNGTPAISAGDMPTELTFWTCPVDGSLVQTAKFEGKSVYLTDIQIDGHGYFDAEVDNGNSGSADTIDWTAGNKQKSTLTDDCTFTFDPDPSGPCNLILVLVQDDPGSRTVTWPGTVKWPAGTAPTLTTDADAVDIICFYYDGTNYFGTTLLDFG